MMASPGAIKWKRLSPERGLSKMHRFPIPSTEITQVGYQEDSETLEIQFIKGEVYQFFNVPSSVFDEFMSAPPARALHDCDLVRLEDSEKRPQARYFRAI